MRRITFTILFIIISFQWSIAQVGIGTDTPDGNAILDVSSSSKGLLPPRVTLSGTHDAAPLSGFVAGMTVYNMATAGDVTPGLYYSDGTKWVRVSELTNTVDFINVSRGLSDESVNTGNPIHFNIMEAVNNINYNSGSGLFSLLAGKTYRLIASISTNANQSWQWAKSDGTGINSVFNSNNQSNGSIEIIYSPLIDTDVKLINQSGNATVIAGKSSVTIMQIGTSGYNGITMNTVEYINAKLAGNSSVANGSGIPFTTLQGNIQNTSGVFSLKAGKTYHLQASCTYGNAEGGAEVFYQWRDITNNILFGCPGTVIPNNYPTGNAPQSIADAWITPSANITVKLENTTGASRTFSSASWCLINQIGSTAQTSFPISQVTNNTAPSNYIDIGDTRIQWGRVTSTSGTGTVTLPVAFKDANYSASGNIIGTNTAVVYSLALDTFSSTAFTWVKKYSDSGVNGNVTEGFNWIAIGQKP